MVYHGKTAINGTIMVANGTLQGSPLEGVLRGSTVMVLIQYSFNGRSGVISGNMTRRYQDLTFRARVSDVLCQRSQLDEM
jgi:hypothetical protein